MAKNFEDGVEDVQQALNAGREVRGHGPYGMLIGDERLEFRPVVIADPVPTRRQILEAADVRDTVEHLLFLVSHNGLLLELGDGQTVDLRSAGSQWNAMAQTLADRAAQLTDEAASTGGAAATLESSLRARVQAANYRHAATQWQDLVRASQVTLALRTGGPTGAARSWLLTAASPPQMLDVAVEGLAFSRVLALAAAALVGIVVAAGVLWRLL